jgi:hypothetical protein
VRKYAADRYHEGYERGVHDSDAAAILAKLVTLHQSAGLLRFAPSARALACLFWAFADAPARGTWHRRAQSLARLRGSFAVADVGEALASDLGEAIALFVAACDVPLSPALAPAAGRYLVEELAAERPHFVASSDAIALKDGLLRRLDALGTRRALEDDLSVLEGLPNEPGGVADRFALARAWVDAWVSTSDDPEVLRRAPFAVEAAALVVCDRALDHAPSTGLTVAEVVGLLGQHARVHEQKLELRIDEFLERLGTFARERVPAFLRYRELRQSLIERARVRLRLDELKPRVLTSFVRNRLIDEVYLPVIGDNLAKQLGASGEGKRTDLMGMLLLISPPGYGKTTLMEYVASRLGLAFVKVNGPSLGHAVTSVDPTEAPNATARQEVDKINLALEMGNNVMLYLDDIQHTNTELLQKFISLCDAQRRIEGVWNGRTRTYDLRGKKFCVVMAGNPYTESGEKFQIPDMLANRADTYNLGDILQGKDDLFALSYIENAITSSRTLAPLSTREPADMYKLVRMAQGEEIAGNDLAHGYSAVEIGEITAVLQRLFKVQRLLLDVNKQYIASASMDDRFRVEPPFKLQGSYRNMNKLTEKVVAAMNDDELERLLDDHYVGEAQTLTTGAEQNLLKLAELRGRQTPEQTARWEKIKNEYQRLKLVGGADDDPVTRVTGQLSALAEQLRAIGAAVTSNPLAPELKALGDTVRTAAAAAAARKPDDEQGSRDKLLVKYLQHVEDALQGLASPKIELRIQNEAPPGIDELLAQQIAIIERTLVPLVRTTNEHWGNPTAVDLHVQELLRLMRAIDDRLRAVFTGVPALGERR